jgi:hypothetical protein
LAASSRQAELVAFCANTDLGRKAAGSCAIASSGTFRVFTDCHDGRRLLNARALKRKEPMAEELRIRQSIWQKCCAAWKLTNRLLLQV